MLPLLVSCGGTSEEPTDLELIGVFDSEWMAGRALVPETGVRLRFSPLEIHANAGCNSLYGNHHFDGHELVVPGLASTDIGCEPALHEQDVWLQGFLMGHPTAKLADRRLTLTTSDVTMRLIAPEYTTPDLPLTGTRWTGSGIGDGVGVTFSSSSSLLTVAFSADGQFEAFSGCQHGYGSFVAGDGEISFTDLVFDGAECADPNLVLHSESFLFVLDGSEVSFDILVSELTIERAGTTLYFSGAD